MENSSELSKSVSQFYQLNQKSEASFQTLESIKDIQQLRSKNIEQEYMAYSVDGTMSLNKLAKSEQSQLYFPKVNQKIEKMKDIESFEQRSNIMQKSSSLLTQMQSFSDGSKLKIYKSVTNFAQMKSGYLFSDETEQSYSNNKNRNKFKKLTADDKIQPRIKQLLIEEGERERDGSEKNLEDSEIKQQDESSLLKSKQGRANYRKSVQVFQEKKDKLKQNQKKQLQTGSFSEYPLTMFDEQEINEPNYEELFKQGEQIGWTRQMQEGIVRWTECTVSEYDTKRKMFKIHVPSLGKITSKYVKRLNIMFTFDNKIDFEQRYRNAVQVRQDFLLLQNNNLNLNEEASSIKINTNDDNFQRIFKKTFLPRIRTFLDEKSIETFKQQILQLFKFHIVEFMQKYSLTTTIEEFFSIYLKSFHLKEKPLSQKIKFTGLEYIVQNSKDCNNNQQEYHKLEKSSGAEIQKFELQVQQKHTQFCEHNKIQEFFYNKQNKDNYNIRLKGDFSNIEQKVKLFQYDQDSKEEMQKYEVLKISKQLKVPYFCQKLALQKEMIAGNSDLKQGLVETQIRKVQQMMISFISTLSDVNIFGAFLKNNHCFIPTPENINKNLTMNSIQEVKKLDMLAYRSEKGITQMKLDYPDYIRSKEQRYYNLCNNLIGSNIQICFINSVTQIIQYMDEFSAFLPLPEINGRIAEQIGKQMYQKRQKSRTKSNLEEDKIDICVSSDYDKDLYNNENEGKEEQRNSESNMIGKKIQFFRNTVQFQEYDDVIEHRGSNFFSNPRNFRKNSRVTQISKIEEMNKVNNTYSSQKKGIKPIKYKLVTIDKYQQIPTEFFEKNINEVKIINTLCHELLYHMKTQTMPLTLLRSIPRYKLPFRPKFIIQLDYNKEMQKGKQKPAERIEERLKLRMQVYQKNSENSDFTQVKGTKVLNAKSKDSGRREETKKAPVFHQQFSYLDLDQCFFSYNPGLASFESQINEYFISTLEEFQKIPKIGTNGIKMFEFNYQNEYIKVLKSKIDSFLPWTYYSVIAVQLMMNPFQYIFNQQKYLTKDIIDSFQEEKNIQKLVYELKMLYLDKNFFKNQLPSYINGGMFTIDLQKVKTDGIQNIEQYIAELEQALISRLEQKLIESQQKMEFLYKKLSSIPQKIAEFIEFLTFIDSKDLDEYYSFLDDQNEEIELYMDACEIFKLQIEKQSFHAYIESAVWVSKLKALENKAKVILEKLQPQFEKELKQNSANIHQKYQEILKKKDELRQFTQLDDAYNASQLSESLKKEFDQINEQAEIVNQQESFLNLKQTDFSDIPVQLNNLRKYVELWELAKNWKFNKQNWEHSSFGMIDSKELVDIINSGLQLLSELREDFVSEPKMKQIVTNLEDEIIQFNKNTQLLLILRDQCFNQFYWDQLTIEMYGSKKDQNSLNLTTLLKDNIGVHTKFIYDLYKTANMQNKIEGEIYRIEQILHKQTLHFQVFYKDFDEEFFYYIELGENLLNILSESKMHCQVLTQRKIEENLHLMKKVNSLLQISINGKKILKRIFRIQTQLIEYAPLFIKNFAQYQFTKYSEIHALFDQIADLFHQLMILFQSGQQKSVLYLFNFESFDDDEHKLKLSHMQKEEINSILNQVEEKLSSFRMKLNNQIQNIRQQHLRLNLISDNQLLSLFGNVQQDPDVFFKNIVKSCFSGIKKYELETRKLSIEHNQKSLNSGQTLGSQMQQTTYEVIFENQFQIKKIINSQEESIMEEFLPLKAEVSPQGIVEVVEELEEDLKKYMISNFQNNLQPIIKLNMDFKSVWQSIHNQSCILQNACVILNLIFYHDITCIMFGYQMKSANISIGEVFKDYLTNFQNNFKEFIWFYRHNKEHQYGSSLADHSKCQGFIQLILGFMDVLQFLISNKVQNLQNFEFFSLPKFSLSVKQQDLDLSMKDFIGKIDETVYPLMLLREQSKLSKFSEHNVYFKHFEKCDYQIQLISMNNSLDYSWELQELNENVSFSSIVSFQKQYFQVIKALSHMEGAVIYSNRKNEYNIFRYLGRILGRFCVNVVIQGEYDVKQYIQYALECGTQKGFFVNFDNLHQIETGCLSLLASSLQMIKSAFFNETKINMFNTSIHSYYVNENFGLFCSYLSSEYTQSITSKIHQNIQDHFRIISLNAPNFRQIIQGYLRGIDIADNFSVSLKLVSMFQLLEISLQNSYLFLNNPKEQPEELYRNMDLDNGKQNYYHMSMAKIQGIFSIVQYFVYDKQIDQYQKGQMELIIYSSMYNYFSRIYETQELKIFHNVFLLFFPQLNTHQPIYKFDYYLEDKLYQQGKSPRNMAALQIPSLSKANQSNNTNSSAQSQQETAKQEQQLPSTTTSNAIKNNKMQKRKRRYQVQENNDASMMQNKLNDDSDDGSVNFNEDDIHDPQERLRVKIKNFYLDYLMIFPSKQILEITHQMVNMVLHKQNILITGQDMTFKYVLQNISQQYLEIKRLQNNLHYFFIHYIHLEGNSLDHLLGYWDDSQKALVKGYIERIFEQIYRCSYKSKFTNAKQDCFAKNKEIFNSEKIQDVKKVEEEQWKLQQEQEKEQEERKRKRKKIDYSNNQQDFKDNSHNGQNTQDLSYYQFDEQYDWLIFEFFNSKGIQTEDEKIEILMKQIQQREFQQESGKTKINREQQVIVYCQNISNFSPSTLSTYQHIHLESFDLKEIFLNWLERELIKQNSFFSLCEKTLRICYVYIFEQMDVFLKKVSGFKYEQVTKSGILRNFLNYLEILLNEFRKLKIVRGEYIIPEATANNSSIESMAVYSSITSYRSKQKKLEQKIDFEELIDSPVQAIFIFSYIWAAGNIFCENSKQLRQEFSDHLMKCLNQLQHHLNRIYPAKTTSFIVGQNLKKALINLKQENEQYDQELSKIRTVFDVIYDVQKNEWISIELMENINLNGEGCIDHNLSNDYFSVREMMRIYPQIFEVEELRHIQKFQRQISDDKITNNTTDQYKIFILNDNIKIAKYFQDLMFYYGKNISISGSTQSGKSSLMEYQQRFYEQNKLDIGIFLKKLYKQYNITQAQKTIEKSFLKKSSQILVNKDSYKKFGIIYIDDLNLAHVEVQSAIRLLKRDFSWYSQHRKQYTKFQKIRVAANTHHFKESDFQVTCHFRLQDLNYNILSTIFQQIVLESWDVSLNSAKDSSGPDSLVEEIKQENVKLLQNILLLAGQIAYKCINNSEAIQTLKNNYKIDLGISKAIQCIQMLVKSEITSQNYESLWQYIVKQNFSQQFLINFKFASTSSYSSSSSSNTHLGENLPIPQENEHSSQKSQFLHLAVNNNDQGDDNMTYLETRQRIDSNDFKSPNPETFTSTSQNAKHKSFSYQQNPEGNIFPEYSGGNTTKVADNNKNNPHESDLLKQSKQQQQKQQSQHQKSKYQLKNTALENSLLEKATDEKEILDLFETLLKWKIKEQKKVKNQKKNIVSKENFKIKNEVCVREIYQKSAYKERLLVSKIEQKQSLLLKKLQYAIQKAYISQSTNYHFENVKIDLQKQSICAEILEKFGLFGSKIPKNNHRNLTPMSTQNIGGKVGGEGEQKMNSSLGHLLSQSEQGKEQSKERQSELNTSMKVGPSYLDLYLDRPDYIDRSENSQNQKKLKIKEVNPKDKDKKLRKFKRVLKDLLMKKGDLIYVLGILFDTKKSEFIYEIYDQLRYYLRILDGNLLVDLQTFPLNYLISILIIYNEILNTPQFVCVPNPNEQENTNLHSANSLNYTGNSSKAVSNQDLFGEAGQNHLQHQQSSFLQQQQQQQQQQQPYQNKYFFDVVEEEQSLLDLLRKRGEQMIRIGKNQVMKQIILITQQNKKKLNKIYQIIENLMARANISEMFGSNIMRANTYMLIKLKHPEYKHCTDHKILQGYFIDMLVQNTRFILQYDYSMSSNLLNYFYVFRMCNYNNLISNSYIQQEKKTNSMLDNLISIKDVISPELIGKLKMVYGYEMEINNHSLQEEYDQQQQQQQQQQSGNQNIGKETHQNLILHFDENMQNIVLLQNLIFEKLQSIQNEIPLTLIQPEEVKEKVNAKMKEFYLVYLEEKQIYYELEQSYINLENSANQPKPSILLQQESNIIPEEGEIYSAQYFEQQSPVQASKHEGGGQEEGQQQQNQAQEEHDKNNKEQEIIKEKQKIQKKMRIQLKKVEQSKKQLGELNQIMQQLVNSLQFYKIECFPMSLIVDREPENQERNNNTLRNLAYCLSCYILQGMKYSEQYVWSFYPQICEIFGIDHIQVPLHRLIQGSEFMESMYRMKSVVVSERFFDKMAIIEMLLEINCMYLIVKDSTQILFNYIEEKLKYPSKFNIEEFIPGSKTSSQIIDAIEKGKYLIIRDPNEQLFNMIKPIIVYKKKQFIYEQVLQKYLNEDYMQSSQPQSSDRIFNYFGKQIIMHKNFRLVVIQSEQQNKGYFSRKKLKEYDTVLNDMILIDLNFSSKELFGNMCNDSFVSYFYRKEKEFYIQSWAERIEQFKQHLFSRALIFESLTNLEFQDQKKQAEFRKLYPDDTSFREKIRFLEIQFQSEKDGTKLEEIDYDLSLYKDCIDILNLLNYRVNPQVLKLEIPRNFNIEKLDHGSQKDSKMIQKYHFKQLIKQQIQFLPISEYIYTLKLALEELKGNIQRKNKKDHIYFTFISDKYFLDQIRSICSEFNRDSVDKRVPQEFFGRFLSKFYKNIYCSLDREDQQQFQLIYVQILQMTAYNSRYNNFDWSLLKNYNVIDTNEFLGFQTKDMVKVFQSFYDSTKNIFDFGTLAPLINFNIEFKKKAVAKLVQNIFQKQKQMNNTKKQSESDIEDGSQKLIRDQKENSKQKKQQVETDQKQQGFSLGFLTSLTRKFDRSNSDLIESQDEPKITKKESEKQNKQEQEKEQEQEKSQEQQQQKPQKSTFSFGLKLKKKKSEENQKEDENSQNTENQAIITQKKSSTSLLHVIAPLALQKQEIQDQQKEQQEKQQEKPPLSQREQKRQSMQMVLQGLRNQKQQKTRNPNYFQSNVSSFSNGTKNLLEDPDENDTSSQGSFSHYQPYTKDSQRSLIGSGEQIQYQKYDSKELESSEYQMSSYIESSGSFAQQFKFQSMQEVPKCILQKQKQYQNIYDKKHDVYEEGVLSEEFSSDSDCSISQEIKKKKKPGNSMSNSGNSNQLYISKDNRSDSEDSIDSKIEKRKEKNRKRKKFFYCLQNQNQELDNEVVLGKFKKQISQRYIDINHKKTFLQLKQLQEQNQQETNYNVSNISLKFIQSKKYKKEDLENYDYEQLVEYCNQDSNEPVQKMNYNLNYGRHKLDLWYIGNNFIKTYIENRDIYSQHYSIDIPSLSFLPQSTLKSLQNAHFMKKVGHQFERKKMSLHTLNNGFLNSLLMNTNKFGGGGSRKEIDEYGNNNQTNLNSQIISCMNLEDNENEDSDGSDESDFSDNNYEEQHQNHRRRNHKEKREGLFNTNKVVDQKLPYDYHRHWFGNVSYQSLYTLLDLTRNLDIKEFVYSLNLEKKNWQKVLFSPESTIYSAEFIQKNKFFSDFMKYTPDLTQLLLMKLFRPDLLQRQGLQLMSKTAQAFEKISSDNINQHISSQWLNKPTILYCDKAGFSSIVFIENKAVQMQKKSQVIKNLQDLKQIDEKEDQWIILENFESFEAEDIIKGFRIIQQKLREADYYNGGENLKIWIIINYQVLKKQKKKFRILQQISCYCWILFNAGAKSTKQEYTDILHVEMEEFLKNKDYSLVKHKKLKQSISIPQLHIFGKYDLAKSIQVNMQKLRRNLTKTVESENKTVNLHSFFYTEKFHQEQIQKGDNFEEYSQKVKYDSLLFFSFFKQRLNIKNRPIHISNQQFSDIVDSLLIFLFEFRMKPHVFVKKYFDFVLDNFDFNSVYKLYFERNFKEQQSININHLQYKLFQLTKESKAGADEVLFEQVNSLPDKDSYEVYALSTNTELINNYWNSQMMIQNLQIINGSNHHTKGQNTLQNGLTHHTHKRISQLQDFGLRNKQTSVTINISSPLKHFNTATTNTGQDKQQEYRINLANSGASKKGGFDHHHNHPITKPEEEKRKNELVSKLDLLKIQLLQYQQKHQCKNTDDFFNIFADFSFSTFGMFRFEDLAFFSDLTDISDNVIENYQDWISKFPNIFEENQTQEVTTFQNLRRLSTNSFQTTQRRGSMMTPRASELLKPKKDIDVALQDFSSFIQNEKKKKRQAIKLQHKSSISDLDQDQDYKQKLMNLSNVKKVGMNYPRENIEFETNTANKRNSDIPPQRQQQFRRADTMQKPRPKTMTMGSSQGMMQQSAGDRLTVAPPTMTHHRSVSRQTLQQIDIVEEEQDEDEDHHNKSSSGKNSNGEYEDEEDDQINLSQEDDDDDDDDDLGIERASSNESLNESQDISISYMRKRSTYIEKRMSKFGCVKLTYLSQQTDKTTSEIQINQPQDTQRSGTIVSLSNVEEDEEAFTSPSQVQIFQLQIMNEIRCCNSIVKKIQEDLAYLSSIYFRDNLLELSEELKSTFYSIQRGETPRTWVTRMWSESKYLYQQKNLLTDFIKQLMIKFEYLKVLIQQRNCKMYQVIYLNKMFNPFQLIANLIWAQAVEYQKPIYQFKVMVEFIDEDKEVLEEQFERHGIQAKGISIRQGRIASDTLFLEEARLREFEYHFPVFRLFVVPHNSEKKTEEIGIYLHNKQQDQEKEQLKKKKEQSEHIKIKIDNPMDYQTVLPFNFVFHLHSDKKQDFWDNNETKITFAQVFQTE